MPSKRRPAVPLAYGAIRVNEPTKDKCALLLLKPEYRTFTPDFGQTEVKEVASMRYNSETRRTWEIARDCVHDFYRDHADLANKFDLFIYSNDRVFLRLRGEEMRKKHIT